MHPKQRDHRTVSASSQRGAATLIVVMILFFIVSLTAAYTSRNLIFEQRTSANQFRATSAFEAADAGMEWATAQLNVGRMEDDCTPTVDDATSAKLSFRERYLDIDATTGALSAQSPSGSGSVTPMCVFDNTGADTTWNWKCRCPKQNASTTALVPPASTGPAPAFMVAAANGPRADLIEMFVFSCNRYDTTCLNTPTQVASGDSAGLIRAYFALRGSLTRPPAAALTVSDALTLSPLSPAAAPAALQLVNADTKANGVTLHVGGTIPTTGIVRTGLAGTPDESTQVVGDTTALQPPAVAASGAQQAFSDSDRRFASFFGMRPLTYMRQPGLVTVDCSAGCSAATINTAMSRNPGRAVWVTGTGGTLTLDANVGSVAAPALLIVEGDLAISTGVIVRGLIYGRKSNWTWTVSGNASVVGAAVAEGSLLVSGASSSTTITYDATTLTALRLRVGTFVRVPGSWRDFTS